LRRLRFFTIAQDVQIPPDRPDRMTEKMRNNSLWENNASRWDQIRGFPDSLVAFDAQSLSQAFRKIRRGEIPFANDNAE
jgi:hypothetical protein